ncbi:MAG TPA: M13 family metallopeptidase [Steroidobacteraceae bacterium]|jgi:endothelin-converting enzyme/putative endopeptidase
MPSRGIKATALGLALSAALSAAPLWAAESKAGDDFFRYANEAWLNATNVQSGQGRFGARDEIAQMTQTQLKRLIHQSVSAQPGSPERKVGDFYSAYLDTAAIERSGESALHAAFERIDALADKSMLARHLGAELRIDVDPLNFAIFESPNLFGLWVGRGVHGEDHYLAYLLEGGLTLPSREAYLDGGSVNELLRRRFLDFVARALARAGLADAPARAARVLALETLIARAHATAAESEDSHNTENLWRAKDFAVQAPGFDWQAFFAAAGLSEHKQYVVWQSRGIAGSAALLGSQPLEDWKDYLRIRFILHNIETLPANYREAERALRGGLASRPRAEVALAAVNSVMADAVGRSYTLKYFPAAEKAFLAKVAANITKAFERRVGHATWMADTTKAKALLKLRTFYFGVGYPDAWPDFSTLTIAADDAGGNVDRVASWRYRRELLRLKGGIDPHEWIAPAQVAAAYYIPQQNGYNFAAALLQPPKFEHADSPAALYGSIGAIFGHEISHFIDLLGADTDERGAQRHWWSDEDKRRFEELGAPLAAQFSAYRPFPDLAVDGQRTLSENIADLGGLEAALEAFHDTLGEKAVDRQYLARVDREFFLAFARAWRVSFSDAGLRNQTANSDHAPEMYRVDTVRNLDEWYWAFDIRPGDRLYLAPKDRVHVW